jgi:lysophospholipase L1-like esterase
VNLPKFSKGGNVKKIVFAASVAAVSCAWASPIVKDGEKIAFMGDSITQFGNVNAGGYVNLIMDGLKRAGVKKLVKIPAGVSGNKSNQMLARLQRDVLDKKPDWMLLSCGVNDVGHGKNGVELEPYKKNISEIAECLGFYDGMYFSKVFKKYYPVAPSEYRRLYGQKE